MFPGGISVRQPIRRPVREVLGVSMAGEERRMEAGREWTQQGQNTHGEVQTELVRGHGAQVSQALKEVGDSCFPCTPSM